jgi:virginiamycin A acetyltransferase
MGGAGYRARVARGARARIKRLLAEPAGPSQWERLSARGIVSVGDATYGHESITIHEWWGPGGEWLGHRLSIGRYCSIAPCQVFLGGNHHREWVSQFPFRTRLGLPGSEGDSDGRGDVTIGHDVWVGLGATILSGVNVGHGAVVGAQAVVARDVEPYAVVAGNPARQLHLRFGQDQIDHLLGLAWWDWPAQKIRDNIDQLSAPPESSELGRLQP